MKKLYKNHPLILGFGIILLGLLLSNLGGGDEFVVTEYQVTDTTLWETTPTLGNDGINDLVVYTQRDFTGSYFTEGDIFYQRLVGGVPVGNPVQVTSNETDDQINDVSGDHIVYTAFDSLGSAAGTIMHYRISTGELQPIGSAVSIQEARIHDEIVVYRQGGAFSSHIMYFDLTWWPSVIDPAMLPGQRPPTFDVEIGDRFIVWCELSDGQFDIVAYDLTTGRREEITSTPDTDEWRPATSGSWIAWQAVDHGSPLIMRIRAYDFSSDELRELTKPGRRPRIDGDLLTFESDDDGNFNVYVYRISTGETFTVTTDPSDQYLNDVFGDLVAYVDQRTGNEDIYVAKLEFITCYPELPAPELIVTGKEDYIGSDGQEYTRYLLCVTNWSEFPDELFEAAPDLPPPNASRTRVDVYDQDDTRLYGFSTLSASEELTALWFAVLKGEVPPDYVYITLKDRRCDITYTSNLASVPPWEETVEVLNQTLDTINELDPEVFKNPNRQTPLTNKINAVLEKIEQGLYQEALDKLEHDILAKTDGCANTGTPDRNDWIVDCEAQNQVYPVITEAIELLRDLI